MMVLLFHLFFLSVTCLLINSFPIALNALKKSGLHREIFLTVEFNYTKSLTVKTYRKITSLSDNYCNSNTVYSSMTNFIMYINSLYTVCIENIQGALCVNVKYCLNNLRKNPILFFFVLVGAEAVSVSV